MRGDVVQLQAVSIDLSLQVPAAPDWASLSSTQDWLG